MQTFSCFGNIYFQIFFEIYFFTMRNHSRYLCNRCQWRATGSTAATNNQIITIINATGFSSFFTCATKLVILVYFICKIKQRFLRCNGDPNDYQRITTWWGCFCNFICIQDINVWRCGNRAERLSLRRSTCISYFDDIWIRKTRALKLPNATIGFIKRLHPNRE